MPDLYCPLFFFFHPPLSSQAVLGEQEASLRALRAEMAREWQAEAEALRRQTLSSLPHLPHPSHHVGVPSGLNLNSSLEGLLGEIQGLINPSEDTSSNLLLLHSKGNGEDDYEDEDDEEGLLPLDPSLSSTLRYSHLQQRPNPSAAARKRNLQPSDSQGVLLMTRRIMRREVGVQRAARALEVRARGMVDVFNHAQKMAEVRNLQYSLFSSH